MISITKKDILWSYLAQGIQVSAGIILLPLLLRKLESKEVGVWYIFNSIIGLAALLDFGFQTTITRNISYVFSGAKEVFKEGIKQIDYSEKIDYVFLSKIIFSVKKIYRIVAIYAFLILLFIGTFYVKNILFSTNQYNRMLLTWSLLIIGTIINLYYYYYSPLLLGRGLIKEYQKTVIFSKLSYLLCSLLLLKLNFGLLGVSISLIISGFLNRALSKKYFFDDHLKERIDMRATYSKKEIGDIIKALWHNSYKSGLIALSGFFIAQSGLLLLPKYVSLDLVASYGLTVQVFSIMTTISTIYFSSHIPFFNSCRITGKIDELKIKLGHSININVLVMILIGSFVIFFGNKVLDILGSNTVFLSKNYLIIMVLYSFLEINHSMFCTILSTKNEIIFLKGTLLTAVFIVASSMLFLRFFNDKILVVLGARFIVQFAYNNWKWPLLATKDLGTSYFKLIINSARRIRLEIKE